MLSTYGYLLNFKCTHTFEESNIGMYKIFC